MNVAEGSPNGLFPTELRGTGVSASLQVARGLSA